MNDPKTPSDMWNIDDPQQLRRFIDLWNAFFIETIKTTQSYGSSKRDIVLKDVVNQMFRLLSDKDFENFEADVYFYFDEEAFCAHTGCPPRVEDPPSTEEMLSFDDWLFTERFDPEKMLKEDVELPAQPFPAYNNKKLKR